MGSHIKMYRSNEIHFFIKVSPKCINIIVHMGLKHEGELMLDFYVNYYFSNLHQSSIQKSNQLITGTYIIKNNY